MAAPTVTELLERLTDVDDRGLRFEETELSWREHVALSRQRAALLQGMLGGPAPKHIGILMDNIPEFSLLLGAAALSGSVVVGLNTTRRGAALARDITLAECRVVFTEAAHASLLDGMDLGEVRVIDVDSPGWATMLAPFADTVVETAAPSPDDLFMLIFTSGTSGDPKAVRCTHRKFTEPATMLATRFGLGPGDTVYVAMPLFHSNAMIAGWSSRARPRGGSVAL
ncbi:AMP-binding protein, partial [Rhodococcus sp. R1101]|uniref:AMP-binding protein n=1 Tax=Rhodococcus sp. R1101 TaxID=1170698 RepID=UPI000375ECA5